MAANVMELRHVQPASEELRVVLETGLYLRDAERYDEAEEVFRGLMVLLPDSDLPRVALGTVEMMRGRLAEALVAYEEALRVCPFSSYARVHRAEALLLQRRRSEAEAELNQVILGDPASPYSRVARTLLDGADVICARIADAGV